MHRSASSNRNPTTGSIPNGNLQNSVTPNIPTRYASSILGVGPTQAPLCAGALTLEGLRDSSLQSSYMRQCEDEVLLEAGGNYFMHNDISHTIYRND